MKRQGRSWLKQSILSLGLLGVAMPAVFAQEDPSKLTQPVMRVSKNEVVAPNSVPHPLDPAIQLAHQSIGMIQRDLNDYTGVLVKREKIGSTLGEHEFMFIKIRNRKMENNQIVTPFSVYLAFLKPAAVKGREVIFVENQNDGNLIAHEGGMKRMLGTHSLPPTGMLAMAGQRYPLTDIGIENLVVKLIERGERDKRHGMCNVELIPGAKVSKRECSIIQVTHPVQQPHYDFHIAQIFMDDQLKIPVRYAAYDWPKKQGGELEVIEEYTYQDLKFNVGLTDADFDPNNKEYNFHKR
ncbi:MAG: DUF1571 domain-containing protein [Pirellula sp.]|jgi:hypothetical protein|nr:DUF1571 domain-containing protein [Pirellula sp.]